MKRRLVAAGLVLLFPLGMAACGSQSKADACKEINNARDKALEQVDALSVFSGSEDFKNKLDTFLAIHKEAAKKVTNKGVKTAFTDVLDDLDKLIGLLNTDENASASPDYESIQDSMDTHGEALNNLCSFTWDR